MFLFYKTYVVTYVLLLTLISGFGSGSGFGVSGFGFGVSGFGSGSLSAFIKSSLDLFFLIVYISNLCC